MTARPEKISLALTKEEKETLRKEANDRGLSMSGYLRQKTIYT